MFDFSATNIHNGLIVTGFVTQKGTKEEWRDVSIAWRHLFTLDGNNDDKSETI